MEKAILFEPELLAEVERESPAVYESYCITPFAKIEFADNGIMYKQYSSIAMLS